MRRWELLLAPLCGVLLTLALAPFDLKPLAPVALALFFWLQERSTHWRRAALLAWLMLSAHFVSGVYWIYISTHIYGGAAAWLGVLLCVALLTVYMPLFPVPLFALLRWRALPAWAGWMAMPAVFTLGEMMRGHVLWKGFAWLCLGDAALDTPLARLVPIVGVHGITLVIALSGYALYRLVADRRLSARVRALMILVAPPALCLLLPAGGSWTQDSGAPLTAAIVQPDVLQEDKWQEDMQMPILQRHLDLTRSVLGADLIVWPEVSLTQPYHLLAPYVLPLLDREARAANSALIFGVVIRDDDSGGYYNSVLALGAASGRYNKRHLVPFGEYFPIPDFIRPLLDVLGTPYSDFLVGREDQPPLAAKNQQLGIYICFEDVFGNEFRTRARGTTLSVSVTNDAWFGHSGAAAQHLAMGRMRSLETGRMTLRASN
ncbi:MAG TPA: apolipoprotein N-acyltransferase, partial [Nevskiaceae bacterium]|nr:apolipoprotein N-acyltransferase [Nevskiaceae bacterium]